MIHKSQRRQNGVWKEFSLFLYEKNLCSICFTGMSLTFFLIHFLPAGIFLYMSYSVWHSRERHCHATHAGPETMPEKAEDGGRTIPMDAYLLPGDEPGTQRRPRRSSQSKLTSGLCPPFGGRHQSSTSSSASSSPRSSQLSLNNNLLLEDSATAGYDLAWEWSVESHDQYSHAVSAATVTEAETDEGIQMKNVVCIALDEIGASV